MHRVVGTENQIRILTVTELTIVQHYISYRGQAVKHVKDCHGISTVYGTGHG